RTVSWSSATAGSSRAGRTRSSSRGVDTTPRSSGARAGRSSSRPRRERAGIGRGNAPKTASDEANAAAGCDGRKPRDALTPDLVFVTFRGAPDAVVRPMAPGRRTPRSDGRLGCSSMAERPAVNRQVAGSSPAAPAPGNAAPHESISCGAVFVPRDVCRIRMLLAVPTEPPTTHRPPRRRRSMWLFSFLSNPRAADAETELRAELREFAYDGL